MHQYPPLIMQEIESGLPTIMPDRNRNESAFLTYTYATNPFKQMVKCLIKECLSGFVSQNRQ